MALSLLSKTSICFHIPIPAGYFFSQGRPSRSVSGGESMPVSLKPGLELTEPAQKPGRRGGPVISLELLWTMTVCFIHLFPEPTFFWLVFKDFNAIGVNHCRWRRWTSTTQVKDCCRGRKGKTPPAPCSAPVAASTQGSAGSHHFSCPRLHRASRSGWHHCAQGVVPLAKQGVYKPPPQHFDRLDHWVLLSHALGPLGHGQSGWWRSSCSCNGLPVTYGHGAASLLVVTCKWKWAHWQHGGLREG